MRNFLLWNREDFFYQKLFNFVYERSDKLKLLVKRKKCRQKKIGQNQWDQVPKND